MRRIGILVFVLLITSSCYLTKQGYYLLSHQYNAKKIDEVLKDPGLSDKERNMLLSIKKIKQFGTERIGLIENDNYTTYVRIDKNYLLDIVSACAKDRFADYTWWYPFFGTFPYKGFYERADAEDEARWLRQYNLDVLIRKSDAYSTLGFFNDPLYSYMADYSPYELASLIFHEMTHATVYVKSQMQFNENLASFVEREGGLLYIREFYGEDSKEYVEAKNNLKDSASFLNQMKILAHRLNQLYQSDISYQRKVQEREIVFEAFKKEYMENYDRNFQSGRYRFVQNLKMNNAYIRLFLLYEEKLSLFYQYYEKYGRNLRKMLESLKKIDESGENPFDFIRKKIDEKRFEV